MPRSKSDEDLFRQSTMTFGEHLEELRTYLFRALVGLVVGFIVGLFLGGWVVNFIQLPLHNALTAYYNNQSAKVAQQKVEEFRKAGYPEEAARIAAEASLLPEKFYLNRSELERILSPGDGPVAIAPRTAAPTDEGAEEDSDEELTPDQVLARKGFVPVFLWRPIKDDKLARTSSFSPHEAFSIYIKAALLVGALLASPWIFYQIWAFVAAGLYRHERKYVHVFLPFSLGLFLSGAALAFFFVFEPVLRFLFTFNDWLNIDPDPRISEWLGFVLILPLGFGIAFQLPLVMLFLERIGVFDVRTYLAKWRIAILVIFVLSMFLTPADPGSMMLMAAPLTVLYFGGILLCHYMPRRRSPFDDDLDQADETDKTDKTDESSVAEKPRRRWFWFGLRMVMVAILLAFLVFGWIPWRSAQEQKTAVDKIEKLDGKVYYDFQFDESGKPVEGAKPPGPSVLHGLLGKDFFADVVLVTFRTAKSPMPGWKISKGSPTCESWTCRERSSATRPWPNSKRHSPSARSSAARNKTRAGQSSFRPERSGELSRGSNRLASPFAGANANAILHREDKDLPVADFPGGSGSSPLDDGVDRRLEELLVDGDHQLHLADQVDRELVAPIGLGVPSLAAEALDVHHRQAEDLHVGQGRLDRLQTVGLNNSNDQLHGGFSPSGVTFK